jgi:hypothetical protein
MVSHMKHPIRQIRFSGLAIIARFNFVTIGSKGLFLHWRWFNIHCFDYCPLADNDETIPLGGRGAQYAHGI